MVAGLHAGRESYGMDWGDAYWHSFPSRSLVDAPTYYVELQYALPDKDVPFLALGNTREPAKNVFVMPAPIIATRHFKPNILALSSRREGLVRPETCLSCVQHDAGLIEGYKGGTASGWPTRMNPVSPVGCAS